MKVTVIPIVIGELGTVTKVLVQRLEDLEIRGQVEISPIYSIVQIGQNTEKALENCGDLLSLKLQWKPPANAGLKNT